MHTLQLSPGICALVFLFGGTYVVLQLHLNMAGLLRSECSLGLSVARAAQVVHQGKSMQATSTHR